ncbi:hypothetical protein BDZ94DRAFT_1275451 [Collybia nuda]|uniref:Uncharacterized protein n=1 Tax=Collybia nuda TaxID=64659 RepID=A0A9P5XTD1_9AGAR|nr:hypothetical protein BDZ94DRAFT_1275451 [Collybia nuda]
MASASSPNTLGLDFDQLRIKDSLTSEEHHAPPIPIPSQQEDQSETTATSITETREKKKPYINPERVKTGGGQRDKLSEEALTERMVRMREQNERIKQRRMDVKADEDAFKKTQESERVKLAQNRKVQESVNRTREQNAKRKMDKIQSREWDSGKPADDWKKSQVKSSSMNDTNEIIPGNISVLNQPPRESSGWIRGSGVQGGSQRGRGRGKGGGNVRQEGVDGKRADLELSSLTTSLKVTSTVTSHDHETTQPPPL